MWLDLFREAARGIEQLLIPHACLICDVPEGDHTDFRHGLCSECYTALATDSHANCPWCAATVGPHADTSEGCPTCRGESFGFSAAWRLGPYEGRLREAIIAMKARFGESLAEAVGGVFAESIAPRLQGEGIELVVPVPLHWRRRWARGHNQADALARAVAAALGVDFRPRALRRVRHTPRQLMQSAAARRENVRGAFRATATARIAGRTILLVDDVMTTGSTMAEAAKTLRHASASRVLAAVLARR